MESYQHIKKLILFILIILLLSGCDRSSEQIQTTIKSGFSGVVTEEGRLYFNYATDCLTFYDFSLDQNLPLCSKPHCNHNTTDCSAYFPSRDINNMAVYNEKLYYWTNETTNSTLWIADKNGENRQEAFTTEKISPRTIAIYSDNKIFYDTLISSYDSHSDTSSYQMKQTENIAYYDIDTGKEIILGSDHTSYWGSLSLIHYYDGKVYYSYSHLKDGLDDSDYDDIYYQDMVNEYYVLDVDTGEEQEFLADVSLADITFNDKYVAYNNWENDHYTLTLLNLQTMETSNIASGGSEFSVRLLDNNVFFSEMGFYTGNQTVTYYSIEDQTTNQIVSKLDDTHYINITQETSDKFIGTLAIYDDDLMTQNGNNISIYILKTDYYNGMKNYVEITDMG